MARIHTLGKINMQLSKYINSDLTELDTRLLRGFYEEDKRKLQDIDPPKKKLIYSKTPTPNEEVSVEEVTIGIYTTLKNEMQEVQEMPKSIENSLARHRMFEIVLSDALESQRENLFDNQPRRKQLRNLTKAVSNRLLDSRTPDF